MKTKDHIESPRTPPTLANPPGGALVWFIIFMEMVTFIAGIFFFFAYKQDEQTLFLEMQQKLNINYAVANTLFLVTSGFFAALSLNYLKNNLRQKSRNNLLISIVLGAGFLILKSIEYSEKINQGYTTSLNHFFTFYWFLTFFHFAHVLFATFILLFLYFKIKNQEEDEIIALEVGTSLWHMCDLIWILLFPTLFIIR